MTFWEGFIVASFMWFIICTISFLFGYIRGTVFDVTAWSDGYDDGYRACKSVYQSKLDEEKHGLNV
jgi:hypothetical protein